MSLPASQQRVLDAIEHRLVSEPRLTSMFAMFTRLASGEALPRREALAPVPWWSLKRLRAPARIRAAVLLTLATAMVVSGILLGMSQSPAGCASPVMLRGPLVGATAHARSCPMVPQAKGYGHGP